MPATTTTLLLLLLLLFSTTSSSSSSSSFLFQGFNTTSLILSNSSTITPNGLLRLTHSIDELGHAFLPTSLPLKHSPSFSTSFAFVFDYPNAHNVGDHGMAFTLSPSPTLPYSSTGQYLGLFNKTSNNDTANHVFAVELDTVRSHDFNDIDNNHVGFDVNGLKSIKSTPASYYQPDGSKKSLTLASGDAMQVWVEYDATNDVVEVTLAPLSVPKPQIPLLSSKVNLSSILADDTYAGFSAATGGAGGNHYVLGWSFSMGGESLPLLDLNALPRPPRNRRRKLSPTLIFAMLMSGMVVVMLSIGGIKYWVRRKRRFEELIEDEELLYGPNRISYKDLYKATKGFKEENLLGAGGFGRVYKGTLPRSHAQVAVKKISHDSSQGVREFVAEITSMARLRHRNLVQLIGYCRRRGELLLVYDYMENGSLDKFLGESKRKGETLSWDQRFKVVRGVAEGLYYLHEGWEQVVVHRDVKASNVLLDADFNGHLGDFGLAKLYDRGDGQQQTTRVVGTLGYLAPEMARTGRATTLTDVYAFGAFLLEVTCGKRPMVTAQHEGDGASPFLVDRVMELWRNRDLLAAVDRGLGNDYSAAEAEILLKLGVLCSHEVPAARPSMRQVVQVLDGDLDLSAMPPEFGSGSTMMAMVAAAEGETPTVSFPSPLKRYGNEYSSLAVGVNSGGVPSLDFGK